MVVPQHFHTKQARLEHDPGVEMSASRLQRNQSCYWTNKIANSSCLRALK